MVFLVNRKQHFQGTSASGNGDLAAYATFEEELKGSIEPGKLADFVLLEKDLMQVPENEIRDVKVLGTYIGGKKVFGN